MASPNIPDQISAFVNKLTSRQQILLVLSVVVVAVTVWFFVRLIGKAEYTTLYSDLSPDEAQRVSLRLSSQNIPYELSADGAQLRVPADRLDSVRLDMASQGMPVSGRLGFELFDQPNWGGSDFAEKVNYQRALEGELERTIQSMNQVESVRVHLVMSKQSLFENRERGAKAAVVLKLRGRRLAEDAVYAITNLVSSAVEQLNPEDVTVVDANGRTPLLSRPNGGIGSAGTLGALGAELEEKLLATLIPVLGADGVRASVTVEYDLSSRENTKETYDPNYSVVTSSQLWEEQLAGISPAGIPGTSSNVPAARAPEVATAIVEAIGESQSQKSQSQTFAVSKTIIHVVDPPGRIRRIATAVLVNDALEVVEEDGEEVERPRKRTPEEMRQIEELAKAAIGFDAERGDFLAVENISFEIPQPEEIAPPSTLEQVLLIVERLSGLLRYLALAVLFGLVYWLLLRPVKKQVLLALRASPAQLAEGRKPGRALAAGAAQQSLPQTGQPLALPAELTEQNEDVKQSVMLKKTLVDKVKKDPTGASRLIQNWVRQDTA